jgi:hypothetical protein
MNNAALRGSKPPTVSRDYLSSSEAKQFENVLKEFFIAKFGDTKFGQRPTRISQIDPWSTMEQIDTFENNLQAGLETLDTKDVLTSFSSSEPMNLSYYLTILSEPGQANDLLQSRRKISMEYSGSANLNDKDYQAKLAQINGSSSDGNLLLWCHETLFQPIKEVVLSPNPTNSELLHAIPKSYPFLLAETMKRFRYVFQDPHLSLYVFQIASTITPLSYILGCTTPTYNELLKIRWEIFCDIKGIEVAIEEMLKYGVELNSETFEILKSVGSEIGRDLLETEVRLENSLGYPPTPTQVLSQTKFLPHQISAWKGIELLMQEHDKEASFKKLEEDWADKTIISDRDREEPKNKKVTRAVQGARVILDSLKAPSTDTKI